VKARELPTEASAPTLAGMAGYFARLGALGFGGPVALADAMRRDLVESRRWLTAAEYDAGLAIAAACPGPLAYQLGVYCGHVRFGLAGGLAVAVCFALAPFVLVLAVAGAYTSPTSSGVLRAVFYGVGPVVVALILKACWSLGTKTLKRDSLAWTLAVVACAITVATQRELTAIFVVSGLLGALLFPRAEAREPSDTPPMRPHPPGGTGRIALLGVGPLVAAPSSTIPGLFLFFLKTGCLVFGSGLVIVPFLKAYVVDEYHWLGDRAFLDAVAAGMISPGPVVITATFVGFVVGGVRGAFAATLGIFSPAVLFTVVAAPIVRRYGTDARLRGFVRGVTAAVVGVLAGTTPLVAGAAIGDALTLGLAVLALVALALRWRCPDVALVAAGAVIGLVAHGG
jgi:chromate transporter